MKPKWQPIERADQLVPGAKVRPSKINRAAIVGRPTERAVKYREGGMVVFTDFFELKVSDLKRDGWEVKAIENCD